MIHMFKILISISSQLYVQFVHTSCLFYLEFHDNRLGANRCFFVTR